jgi:hypothetical protein
MSSTTPNPVPGRQQVLFRKLPVWALGHVRSDQSIPYLWVLDIWNYRRIRNTTTVIQLFVTVIIWVSFGTWQASLPTDIQLLLWGLPAQYLSTLWSRHLDLLHTWCFPYHWPIWIMSTASWLARIGELNQVIVELVRSSGIELTKIENNLMERC